MNSAGEEEEEQVDYWIYYGEEKSGMSSMGTGTGTGRRAPPQGGARPGMLHMLALHSSEISGSGRGPVGKNCAGLGTTSSLRVPTS
jgi:hypothetical protein